MELKKHTKGTAIITHNQYNSSRLTVNNIRDKSQVSNPLLINSIAIGNNTEERGPNIK